MYTLRDVLIALRRLDVGPEEIELPEGIYNVIIQQAQEIVREEEGEELNGEN